MKNKGFLTDIDDTLFATSDFLENALDAALERMIELGLPAKSKEEAMLRLKDIRCVNSNAENHFDLLCLSYSIDSSDKILVTAGVIAYHNTKFSLLKYNRNVRKVFKFLKSNGFKIGAISYGIREKQVEKLERLGVLEYFIEKDKNGIENYIFISESDKKRLFGEAIMKMDLDPNRTISIDDRLEGIYASHQVGIEHTVRICQGKYKGETPYSMLLKLGYKQLLKQNRTVKGLIRLYTPRYEIKKLIEVIEISKGIK